MEEEEDEGEESPKKKWLDIILISWIKCLNGLYFISISERL
jgi:hypothetical protein